MTNLTMAFVSLIVTNWVAAKYEVEIHSDKAYELQYGYVSSNYLLRITRYDGYVIPDIVLDSRALDNTNVLARKIAVVVPVTVVTNVNKGVTNVSNMNKFRSIPPIPKDPWLRGIPDNVRTK